MKRREFIKRTVPVSILPLFIGGFTLRAYGRSPILEALVASGTETDHMLVLIQLNGGNDGLNTVIPLDQYSALSIARSNILLPENNVLKLTNATGLHPSMAGMQSLYTTGKLCVVQGVSYPNPNLSHFRATDIWLTASDSNVTLTTGWLGRYLDQEYPGFPNGYPNAIMPDPLAIQIGSVVSNALQGPNGALGMAITSPTSFYQLITGGVDAAPNTPAGHELTFIRQVAQQTQQYATVIQAAASKGKNYSTLYPSPNTNSVADQLKIVAQLIGGGLKTRLYIVNLGGFDTHSSQVDTTQGPATGQHANLLGKLSVAMTAFQDDLQLMGAQDRVIGMTFSEFGRRIISNASAGTDHGTAAPMFIFGRKVAPGIVGSNPVIPQNATVNDNLAMQYDFRSVYGSLLKEWFGVSQDVLDAVLLKNFQSLPLIAPPVPGPKPDPLDPPPNYEMIKAPSGGDIPTELGLQQNYPNPFNPTTTIPFTSNGGFVQIKVYDTLGREVRTLAEGTFSPGEHRVVFDASELPPGMYYYRMQSTNFQQAKPMVLVK
ncbi:MAG: DUF1501 domain-containing protein [Ignavibacteriae bacterium]|nr:DUF1501 domain-containing protein [Ignavibacteria bacterium]MBI3365763.1 DUF1501 domain-containing protein [Ignavibacteriota bacterium]